ncbi:DNA repair protein recA homolog 2, mitochondrial isoform X2 [Cucurbita moschata]|uniref:DNA repair protein recA homolog 2, mitochondrial isoform X2 n=1 Tax=Cucurbita moschata TaxID=3662 RepID=A0A6J1ES72_CUCMO|nr:DNA repair protein recA homolog 2, mitochondrial isoform X2 [Cucurbita moschata]
MPFFLASSVFRSCRLKHFEVTRLSSLFYAIRHKRRRDVINCLGLDACHFSSLVDVSEFECDKLSDDTRTTEKDAALRLAVTQLAGEFGKESMLCLQRFFSSRNAPVISTGSLKLDLALGIGGLPKGRIVEIYGQEASGKSTLALHIIKEAQKLGGYCAYFDAENAMDMSLAEAMGINVDNLLISPPDTAENLLCAVNTLVKSGSVDVIVVDSVAALVPQSELDALIGSPQKDVQSRVMTRALRKIHYSLSLSETLIVFINQVRSSGGARGGFGQMNEVTCGGNALQFYAAVRLRLLRRGLLKSDDKVTGLAVAVQVVKNKLATSMKTAELRIRFGKGLCCESEVLELGCEHGVILKDGNNFRIEGRICSSKYEAHQYLMENEDVLCKVVEILRNQLFVQ